MSRLLTEAGVPHMLLKGAAFAQLFFDPDETRFSSDLDLLIPCRLVPAATTALGAAGFRKVDFGERQSEPDATAAVFERDGLDVDLHWSLRGIRTAPERVYDLLTSASGTASVLLGEASVPTLGPPGHAFHACLNAVGEGRGGRGQDDLDRALTRLTADIWRRALQIAEELDAVAAFTRGLRIAVAPLPDLAIPESHDLIIALRDDRAPPLAITLAAVRQLPGRGRRLLAIASRVVPSPAYMRQTMPASRRGGASLLLAYLTRAARIARTVPATIAALWEARRRPEER